MTSFKPVLTTLIKASIYSILYSLAKIAYVNMGIVATDYILLSVE